MQKCKYVQNFLQKWKRLQVDQLLILVKHMWMTT